MPALATIATPIARKADLALAEAETVTWSPRSAPGQLLYDASRTQVVRKLLFSDGLVRTLRPLDTDIDNHTAQLGGATTELQSGAGIAVARTLGAMCVPSVFAATGLHLKLVARQAR